MNDRPSASTGLAEAEGDGEELVDEEVLAVGLAGAGGSLAAVELPLAHAAPTIASARSMVMDRVSLITCGA
jgi:hypothetical protein